MKKSSSLLLAATLMASMIGPLPVQAQSASTGGLQMIVYPQTEIMVRRGDYVQYTMFLHNNAAPTPGQYVWAKLMPGHWELIPSGVSPGCTQTDASTVTCADPSSIGYGDQHKYIVTYRIKDTMPCGTVLDFTAIASTTNTNAATSSQRVQSVTVSCSIPEFPTHFSSVSQPGATQTIIYPQHRVGVRRGDTVQYTVMAHNYSQTPAANPTIHATLQPEHWDAVPSGLSPGCAQVSSSTIVCQDGSSVPYATSHDFVLSYRIKDTMPCGSILDLNVSVSPQNGGGSSMRASSVIVLCDTPTPSTTPQCRDGIDNDNDGATDYPADFSCSSPDDNDETNTKSQCQDGIDNDNDGKIDFPQDPGCSSKQDNDESNVMTPALPACSDGLDNDNDGKTDFFDAGCYPNNVFNPALYNPNDTDESNAAALCRWTRVNSQWVRSCI